MLSSTRTATVLPAFLTACAAIALGYLIADTVNLWLSNRIEPVRNQSNIAITADTRADNSNLQLGPLIADAHLFGEYKAPEVSAPKPEPKPEVTRDSRLNIRLTGILDSSNDQNSIAILAESSNPEMFYIVGDEIKPGVKLVEVNLDHIIIDNGGTREKVSLPKDELPQGGSQFLADGSASPSVTPVANNRVAGFTQPNSSRPVASVASAPVTSAPSNNISRPPVQRVDVNSISDSDLVASLPSTAGALRDFMVKNPRALLRSIQVAPYRVDGRTAGFQIRGGAASSVLAQYGLAINDVLTRVNGIELTSQRRALNAMRQVVSAQRVNLTVLRGGSEIPLTIDLTN